MTNNTLMVCSTCQVRKKFSLLLNLPLTPHPRSANDQRPTISYLKSCYWVFWCFLDLTDVTLADWRHTYFILPLFNILLRLDQGKRPGARGLMMAGPPGAYMHIWTLDIIINNPPCQDAPHRILTAPHLPFRVLEPSKSWRLLAENSVSRYESKHCQRRNRPRLLSLKLE